MRNGRNGEPFVSGQRTRLARRGVTMLELMAAVAVFSTVAILVLPVLGRVAQVREETSAHETAVRETANQMERLAALSARHELTEADLNSLTLSDAATSELTGPQLSATLSEPEGEPAAQRLTLTLSWENSAGQRGTPVTLTRYLYQTGSTP